MGLEATASLLIAAFELSAVRLIRDAIRTADLSSGRGLSATPLGPDPNPVRGSGSAGAGGSGRSYIDPELIYEPRRHVCPATRCDGWAATYTVRGAKRIEQADNEAARAGLAVDAPRSSPACSVERTIPPVWKSLPPVEQSPPAPPRRWRVVRQYAAPVRKGLVLDIHV